MTFPEETSDKTEDLTAEAPKAGAPEDSASGIREEAAAEVPEEAAPEEAAEAPDAAAPEEAAEAPDAAAHEEAAEAPEDKPEAGAVPDPKKKAEVKKKPKGKKVSKLRRRKHKILARSAENDIRYRGPLSYRHFRIFAWICLALTQVVLLMELDLKLEPEFAAVFDTPIAVLGSLSALALPLLLIANFAVILDGREGYVRQTLRYGALAAVTGAGCCLFINRYLLGSLGVLLQAPEEAPQFLDMLITRFRPQGFFAFNIFVDLFLCSLFMCLVNCRPKRGFTGKRVLILRFLAVIPAAYEIGCIVLKIMAGNGWLRLPVTVWPFLTTKPPMTFLVFIFLAFYVKRRERLFRRHGRTHEEFMEHMQTNYNSLRFSLFTAKIFFLTALLDVFVVFILPLLILFIGGQGLSGYAALTDAIIASGFGGSIELLPMIPFMLLFSYTRTHKNRVVDAVLPLFGIALIFMVWIEGGYQALQLYGGTLPEGFGDMMRLLIIGLSVQP